jgi:CHAT domain-containing protein/tetratricopeptide (TPR) repeat protein
MQKSRKLREILCRLVPSVSYHGLIWLISVVVLCEGAGATSRRLGLQIAQQPATKPQNTNRLPSEAEAKVKSQLIKVTQLQKEGMKLVAQPSAAVQRQAITKFEQALKILRLPEVRAAMPKESRIFEVNILGSIGAVYMNLTENTKAAKYIEQALTIFREIKEPIVREQEAVMLNGLGTVYMNLGEKQKAIDALKQAQSLFHSDNKPNLEAQALFGISVVYLTFGEPKKMREPLEQALEIHKANNNLPGQASIFGNLASAYQILGETDKALENYNQALEIYRQTKDFFGQADTLSSIGSVYSSRSDRKQAEKYFQQALELQRQLQQKQPKIPKSDVLLQQIRMIYAISVNYSLMGDYQQTINYFNQGRTVARQVGRTLLEADFLSKIGETYYLLGETQKALAHLKQAQKLQQAIHYSQGEAETLKRFASIHQKSGDFQQALDNLNQVLKIYQRQQNPLNEGQTLTSIAGVYKNLGAYELSIAKYEEALKIFQQNYPLGTGSTLADIGNVYWQKGKSQKTSEDYHLALNYLQQALKYSRQQGSVLQEAVTLSQIARVHELLKHYPQAIDNAKKSLELSRKHNLVVPESTALTILSIVYKDTRDYQKALDVNKQNFLLSQQQGDLTWLASAYQKRGEIYTSMKQPQQAIEAYNQQLKLGQQIGDIYYQTDALYKIATIERDRGNLEKAKTQIETGINIIENTRSQISREDLRTSYFASKQDYYEFYIDLLMQLHKQDPSKGYAAKALHTNERARARSLIELLTEANANIREGIKPELLEREGNIQQKLDALEKQRLELPSRPNPEKQIADIKQQIDKLLDDYQQLRTEIRLNSPRYAALKFPEPVTLQDIQQNILDDDTLLLTYSLGEERSYLWLVSKTEIHSYELPKRSEIEAQAEQFHRSLKIKQGQFNSQNISNSAAQLSQMLLQPVANKLGKKRLLIVSDGALQYVPFTALPICKDANCNASTPLLANHEIINSPSVSTIAILRSEHQQRKSAPKTLAVLADPVFSKDDTRLSSQSKQDTSVTKINPNNQSENLDSLLLQRSANESDVTFKRLPSTRKQAENVLALVPQSSRTQAFDFDANRRFAASPELSQYRFVLFATHGILNSANPKLSGVVLSLVNQQGEVENGFLRLNDIFNLKIPAELVVLSACETGLGKEVRGEGLVGLTRGFMYAGSPRLVVSLWKVADEGTSILMTKFYTKMLQQGLKPAEALRAAQLEMLRDEKYSAPYYWAGFTLQGEWK